MDLSEYLDNAHKYLKQQVTNMAKVIGERVDTGISNSNKEYKDVIQDFLVEEIIELKVKVENVEKSLTKLWIYYLLAMGFACIFAFVFFVIPFFRKIKSNKKNPKKLSKTMLNQATNTTTKPIYINRIK